jgi:hypothetical protein
MFIAILSRPRPLFSFWNFLAREEVGFGEMVNFPCEFCEILPVLRGVVRRREVEKGARGRER